MLSDDKVLSSEYRLKKNEYRKLLLETSGGNDISRLYVETEISLLSSALAVAILFTVRAKKKTAAANAELREYVSLLQESNNMKEMYIGRYIDMCSYYIGGLERYRSSSRTTMTPATSWRHASL